ncbi:hypothetical protein ACJX0J_007668, partial [Zea mays]
GAAVYQHSRLPSQMFWDFMSQWIICSQIHTLLKILYVFSKCISTCYFHYEQGVLMKALVQVFSGSLLNGDDVHGNFLVICIELELYTELLALCLKVFAIYNILFSKPTIVNKAQLIVT